MTLAELVDELKLERVTKTAPLDREIRGAHISDLLSEVIANAKADYVWITLQVHPNVVAVASMKDICGVIMASGREPDPETIEKAESEGIPILKSELSGFELAGRLYQLGIRG